MKIRKIDYNSHEFKKVMKDSPTGLIIFNEKADYYCTHKDNEIISICGIVKYKKGYKIVTLFTYEEYRKKHIMAGMIEHLISKYGANYYYANANENSFRIFKRLGFEEKSFTQFKFFNRRVMILSLLTIT